MLFSAGPVPYLPLIKHQLSSASTGDNKCECGLSGRWYNGPGSIQPVLSQRGRKMTQSPLNGATQPWGRPKSNHGQPMAEKHTEGHMGRWLNVFTLKTPWDARNERIRVADCAECGRTYHWIRVSSYVWWAKTVRNKFCRIRCTQSFLS